jgi:1-acyl-sn-glycerol-3-phosphate acyltransferase
VKTIRAELEATVLGPEHSGVTGRQSLFTRAVRRLFEWYAVILFKVYCPLTVVGRDRLPQSSFVFCANHNSHMDSAVLMIAANRGFSKFGMMAAKDYFFENSIRKYFMTLFMNLVPVERKRNDRKAIIEGLAACREFMKDGQRSLIIYPEGTRSRTGKIGSFKKGPAMIATELGVPVVPAYISGTQEAWPKGRELIRPTRIECYIGEAIQPESYLDEENTTAAGETANFGTYKRITAELEQNVRDLETQFRGQSEKPEYDKQRVG